MISHYKTKQKQKYLCHCTQLRALRSYGRSNCIDFELLFILSEHIRFNKNYFTYRFQNMVPVYWKKIWIVGNSSGLYFYYVFIKRIYVPSWTISLKWWSKQWISLNWANWILDRRSLHKNAANYLPRNAIILFEECQKEEFESKKWACNLVFLISLLAAWRLLLLEYKRNIN